ncbi:MAG TPA: hypothetical protein VE775_09780, partial [Pyrinomonadaceae bacterium]|nr:hypothetical protein [Pyrinomonadaceae bacterium]
MLSMSVGRYNEAELDGFAQQVLTDGFCMLPEHFAPAVLDAWRATFMPLLAAHIEREGHLQNRGPARYYVTLPFTQPFADPRIYEDEDVLAIVARLVGADAVMC